MQFGSAGSLNIVPMQQIPLCDLGKYKNLLVILAEADPA
jgi:hypothetical protein